MAVRFGKIILVGTQRMPRAGRAAIRRPVAKAELSSSLERQAGFDPARLVFLDESGAKTNLTRLRGRAPRGARCHASAPT